MKENKMKILILGGSGIISTEIVKLLVKNNDVTIVNRGRRKEFIHPDAKIIYSDMRNEDAEIIMRKITEDYDVVIDFLSYRIDELSKFMKIVANRCEQYIFVSSATVYNTKESRLLEGDPCGNVDWDYAKNKYNCEEYLKSNAEICGFMYTIIRPYITYGLTRIPLQFGPIEYYTIIYRMKNHKCIPLYGNEVWCTLTSSKDFAIPAAGLVGNTNAYGQVYHIVGNYETTWEKVLELEAKAFGCSADIIKVNKELLENIRYTRGIDAKEVLSDKGRTMLFDNTKIKNTVQGFIGNITLEDELQNITSYFNCNKENRKINFAWDGRLDRLLIKSKLLTKQQKAKLKFYPSDDSDFKSKLTYYVNRYEILFMINKLYRKFIKK